ncbi:MAG: phosphoribosylformylglycinamidine synthase subunit PurQ [Elusimicrobiota bacterium]
MKPKALILRGAATNCDLETAAAFRYCGAIADIAHINEVLKGIKKLSSYDMLSLPGGFSYGDDISAGKIFALKIRTLRKDFEKFIKDEKPVIGICNGFQVLVKTGYLPENRKGLRKASLFLNDAGHFICKWVKLKINKKSPCIFTRGLPDEIELPMAHGEGKFIAEDKKELEKITAKNLSPVFYSDNPNGSQADIAGICNEKGNLFGLMPHPERNFFSLQKQKKESKGFLSEGYLFFKNAVDYCR